MLKMFLRFSDSSRTTDVWSSKLSKTKPSKVRSGNFRKTSGKTPTWEESSSRPSKWQGMYKDPLMKEGSEGWKKSNRVSHRIDLYSNLYWQLFLKSNLLGVHDSVHLYLPFHLCNYHYYYSPFFMNPQRLKSLIINGDLKSIAEKNNFFFIFTDQVY